MRLQHVWLGWFRRQRDFFPLTRFVVLFVLTGAMSALTAWQMNHQQLVSEHIATRHAEATRLMGEVLQFDEALTMSARMAATTGNLAFEQRYQGFDERLTHTLEALTALADDDNISNALKATEAANNALVAMEKAGFDAVRDGRTDEATAIIESENYAREKRAYAQGLEGMKEATQKLIMQERLVEQQNSDRWQWMYLVCSLLLLGGWVMAGYAEWSSQRERARTDQLREQMRQAEEAKHRAEANEAAQTRMVSSMTHQLRTPLHGVLGYTQLLALDPLTTDQLEALSTITESGRRLLRIVDGVLQLAALDTKSALQVQTLDPAVVQANALSVQTSLAMQQGIQLNGPQGPPLSRPWVTDPQRLEALLRLLLDNSLRYCPPGAQVGLTWAEQDGQLAWWLTDTGPGIPAHLQSRLFQPFDRLGREDGPVPGAGVGLVTASRLADQLGGTLRYVDRAPSPGAAFCLLLPWQSQ